MSRSYSGMANGEASGSFGWCNLIVKLFLVCANIIVWLLGTALLGVGIFIQVETDSDERITGLGLDSFLSNPAIILMILGAFLFVLGFCGCFGALFEISYLLIGYAVTLTIIILAEVAVVLWIYLDRDNAYDTVDRTLQRNIVNYFNDVNLRDIIDLLQSQLIRCCGINEPNDWQSNVYFNCSSIAFQRCSVPFSCCTLEDGQVINVQCGYRTLNVTSTRHMMGIHTQGCLARVRDVINDNIIVIAGVGIGLLVFQVVNVMLAVSLAVDVRREVRIFKAFKKRQQQH